MNESTNKQPFHVHTTLGHIHTYQYTRRSCCITVTSEPLAGRTEERLFGISRTYNAGQITGAPKEQVTVAILLQNNLLHFGIF